MQWAVGFDEVGAARLVKIISTHKTLKAAEKGLVKAYMRTSADRKYAKRYASTVVTRICRSLGLQEPSHVPTASRGSAQAPAAEKQSPPTPES